MARHVLLTLTFGALVLSCDETAARKLVEDSYHTNTQLNGDRLVWVTVGQDAVPELTKKLKSLKAQLTEGRAKNGVATLRLRESALLTLAGVMHEKFHRCGGFVLFDTEAEAVAALEPATALPTAAPITYTLDNGPAVQTLMGSLTNSNVLATMTQLSNYKNRYYNSATGTAAAQWLKTHWETLAQGRTDVTVETFTHAGWPQPSVILTITGQTLPTEVVVLGAHLDSINISSSTAAAPGVDDDASGIATLTEVIRSVMSNGFKPSRTVKFMGYAAEEVGLRGSKEIAAKHKADKVNVVGVMQLDMTNFHGSSSDIVVFTDYTDAAQNTFVSTLIDTYVQVSRSTSSCGYGCSDHASWHANGYRTSMPFESLMQDSNPNIHTAADTLANSGGTVDHSMKFAKLATAFVGELAKGDFGSSRDGTPPTVSITSPSPGTAVSGLITVSADATDNVGVARVRFMVDGSNIGTDQTPPYTMEWNTDDEAPGAHVITALAFDSSANSATSASVTVNVVPHPEPVDSGVPDAGVPDAGPTVGEAIAVYDPTRKTAVCSEISLRCDSASLFIGRAGLGPEVNAPNTIASSCADGTMGQFHRDESVDRLVVFRADGSPITAGSAVKIEATVFAYSTFTSDRLDLYSAANASDPRWVFITSLTPTVKGTQTLSATLTLPEGGLQAIRARMRYKGASAACGTGGYDDHDDLVFAVAP